MLIKFQIPKISDERRRLPRMIPVYKATTILQITPDNPGAVMGDRDVFASLYASETQGRFYETQYMILNSRPMAFKLMESLRSPSRVLRWLPSSMAILRCGNFAI
jgi:hypothetical protein